MHVLEIVRQLVESPLTGFILAIFSLSLSIFLFKIGRKRKNLLYRVPDRSRAVENVSGYSIKDPGGVARLIGLNIPLWNGGTETIKGADIARLDPLRIQT